MSKVEMIQMLCDGSSMEVNGAMIDGWGLLCYWATWF
jgi:hypothetical protein